MTDPSPGTPKVPAEITRLLAKYSRQLRELLREWTEEDVLIVAEDRHQVRCGLLSRKHTMIFLGDMEARLDARQREYFCTATMADHAPVLVRALVHGSSGGPQLEWVGLEFLSLKERVDRRSLKKGRSLTRRRWAVGKCKRRQR